MNFVVQCFEALDFREGIAGKKEDFLNQVGQSHVRLRILWAKEVIRFISCESCPLFDSSSSIRPLWVEDSVIPEDHIILAIEGKKKCRGRSRRGISKKNLTKDEAAVQAVEELDKCIGKCLIHSRRRADILFYPVGGLSF